LSGTQARRRRFVHGRCVPADAEPDYRVESMEQAAALVAELAG
jgi:hypothetical protein